MRRSRISPLNEMQIRKSEAKPQKKILCRQVTQEQGNTQPQACLIAKKAFGGECVAIQHVNTGCLGDLEWIDRFGLAKEQDFPLVEFVFFLKDWRIKDFPYEFTRVSTMEA